MSNKYKGLKDNDSCQVKTEQEWLRGRRLASCAEFELLITVTFSLVSGSN